MLTRKPQCDRRKDAACSNCRRRYPPVECIFKSEVVFSNGFGRNSFQSRQVDANGGNVKRHASSLGWPSPPQTRPLTPCNFPQEASFADSSLDVEFHPVSISLFGPESSSSKSGTSEATLKRSDKLTPPLDEEHQSLIPQAKTIFHYQLPTIARSMPFGVASFGGVILPDPSVRGSSIERDAELLHFCMVSRPSIPSPLLII